MKKIVTLLSAVFITTSALAEGVSYKDKLACAPDAIKLCIHLDKQKHEPGIINHVIACLQQNRDKLSKRCVSVLEKHGI